jgi:acetyl-CoA carboxylase carboxyltransferase component
VTSDKKNPTWEAMNELLADLEERRKRVRQAGGPERVAKQHAGGKLTARERIDRLVDTGSFVETDVFVEHRGGGLMEGVDAPGEGVVTGYGRVNGRQVFVFSQDFTVMGGSLGKMHAQKICKVMDLAVSTGHPIVGLNDSAGARIQEGVDSLSGYGEVFRRNAVYSGAVPQISAILGPCAGGAVYSPALTDFTLMVQGTSYMFITGPDVIKAVTKEEVTFEELGGADVHAKRSGVAQWVCPDDAECLATVRRLLAYLPDSARSAPPVVETADPWDREAPELLSIVHPDQRRTYPMADVVRAVVDEGEFLEVHEHFARNIIVGLARLAGRTVGVIANNPKHLAGTLTIDASDKAARFIRTCDCFGIPLVTFVDVTGFLPGVNQEHGGIIRHGAKMLYAYSEASVPKVTVVVRKSYGGAYLAMCSKDLGADFVLAWPTAATAVMGAEGAAGIIYRRELQRSADPEATRRDLIDRYRREFDNPWFAAARGYIDDVIDPVQTRPALIRALRALEGKVEERPFKRHGNMPV